LGVNKGVKVVFSSEEKNKDVVRSEDGKNKKSMVETVSYLSPIFGCFISSVVIRELVS
jgi:tRNA A37 threonylcarbamoyladenosine dehydratase